MRSEAYPDLLPKVGPQIPGDAACECAGRAGATASPARWPRHLARAYNGVRHLGTIAAGLSLDLFDEGMEELLEVDELTKAIPHSGPLAHGDIYALQVRGDSMVEDGILNGDYVLIAYGPTVAQEAIAVVVHDSANGERGETTLKRVYVREDEVHLQPANPAYPIRVISRREWESEWRVQGAVVGSYRRYPH